jgi:hypothetical protein
MFYSQYFQGIIPHLDLSEHQGMYIVGKLGVRVSSIVEAKGRVYHRVGNESSMNENYDQLR